MTTMYVAWIYLSLGGLYCFGTAVVASVGIIGGEVGDAIGVPMNFGPRLVLCALSTAIRTIGIFKKLKSLALVKPKPETGEVKCLAPKINMPQESLSEWGMSTTSILVWSDFNLHAKTSSSPKNPPSKIHTAIPSHKCPKTLLALSSQHLNSGISKMTNSQASRHILLKT
jgi:hypothetical protein